MPDSAKMRSDIGVQYQKSAIPDAACLRISGHDGGLLQPNPGRTPVAPPVAAGMGQGWPMGVWKGPWWTTEATKHMNVWIVAVSEWWRFEKCGNAVERGMKSTRALIKV